jgi:hypothetical protein
VSFQRFTKGFTYERAVVDDKNALRHLKPFTRGHSPDTTLLAVASVNRVNRVSCRCWLLVLADVGVEMSLEPVGKCPSFVGTHPLEVPAIQTLHYGTTHCRAILQRRTFCRGRSNSNPSFHLRITTSWRPRMTIPISNVFCGHQSLVGRPSWLRRMYPFKFPFHRMLSVSSTEIGTAPKLASLRYSSRMPLAGMRRCWRLFHKLGLSISADGKTINTVERKILRSFFRSRADDDGKAATCPFPDG